MSLVEMLNGAASLIGWCFFILVAIGVVYAFLEWVKRLIWRFRLAKKMRSVVNLLFERFGLVLTYSDFDNLSAIKFTVNADALAVAEQLPEIRQVLQREVSLDIPADGKPLLTISVYKVAS